MLVHRGDELLAVPSELRLADTRQGRKLVEIERHVLRHLTQRGIVKNDIGRQAILIRQALTQRPQPLEQRIIRGG